MSGSQSESKQDTEMYQQRHRTDQERRLRHRKGPVDLHLRAMENAESASLTCRHSNSAERATQVLVIDGHLKYGYRLTQLVLFSLGMGKKETEEGLLRQILEGKEEQARCT